MKKIRYDAIKWARRVPMMLHKRRKDRPAHHLLLLMATYAKNDGTDVFVSVDTLAQECLMDLAELDEVLGRLRALDYIRPEKASNGADGWALNIAVRHDRDEVVEARKAREREAIRKRVQALRDRRRGGGTGEVDQDVTADSTVTVTPESAVTVTADYPVTEQGVTPDFTVTEDGVTVNLGNGNAQVTVTSAGQSPVTPLNSQVLKEELPPGTTYRATADAARAPKTALDTPPILAFEDQQDGTTILEAEIVEDSPGDALFDSPPAPVKPTKSTRKRKGTDPAKDERGRQALYLAKAYDDAMHGMTSFMGVRGVIATALDRFPYDRVRDGVKHLAQVDRHKPFTRQTLLNAIEATGINAPVAARGPARPVGLPNLSTGDQRYVEGEWLKSAPNWDVLAQFGVTPQNAHHFGWRQPA